MSLLHKMTQYELENTILFTVESEDLHRARDMLRELKYSDSHQIHQTPEYIISSLIGYSFSQEKTFFLEQLFLNSRSPHILFDLGYGMALERAMETGNDQFFDTLLGMMDPENTDHKRCLHSISSTFVRACSTGNASAAKKLLDHPKLGAHVHPLGDHNDALFRTIDRDEYTDMTSVMKILLPLYLDDNTQDLEVIWAVEPYLLDKYFPLFSDTKKEWLINQIPHWDDSDIWMKNSPTILAYIDKKVLTDALGDNLLRADPKKPKAF